jgi:hypothetical protein
VGLAARTTSTRTPAGTAGSSSSSFDTRKRSCAPEGEPLPILDDVGHAQLGGRLAYLIGRVPRELVKNARPVVAGLPDMDMLDVLAAKAGG